jgi:hypothetical protein
MQMMGWISVQEADKLTIRSKGQRAFYSNWSAKEFGSVSLLLFLVVGQSVEEEEDASWKCVCVCVVGEGFGRRIYLLTHQELLLCDLDKFSPLSV